MDPHILSAMYDNMKSSSSSVISMPEDVCKGERNESKLSLFYRQACADFGKGDINLLLLLFGLFFAYLYLLLLFEICDFVFLSVK